MFRFLRRSALLRAGFLLTATVVGLTGCRNTCANVEAELRAREEDVRTLKEDLSRSEHSNQLLQRELSAIHGLPGPTGHIERPTDPWPVRSIRLGRQTAGKAGPNGYDEALIVMVEPLDSDSQPIKVPATLHVAAVEAPDEGNKRIISMWQVPADQLRGKWESGLFTTGYLVTLPWKALPTTPKLRVIVRLRMNNGRTFEADKDITVRVMPGIKPGAMVPGPMTGPFMGPISGGIVGTLSGPLATAPAGVLPGPTPLEPIAPSVPGAVPSVILPPPSEIPRMPSANEPGLESPPPSEALPSSVPASPSATIPTQGPILSQKPIAEILPPEPLRESP
jgi:hypothetical protein